MSKPDSLSSQDVRARVLSLRDELIRNLEFIETCIAQDRVEMEKYFRQFRDLRYRPVVARDTDGNPTEYGSPTEVVREPLAVQFRTTVKSLLDSIRVIESEILPEDNPEGSSARDTSESAKARREAMRDGFKASAGSGVESAPKPVDVEVARTPKPIDTPPPIATPKPKPWRETQPKAPSESPPPQPIETPAPAPAPEAPKAKADPQAVGLSPALRATIAGGARSSMTSIRDKYTKKS